MRLVHQTGRQVESGTREIVFFLLGTMERVLLIHVDIQNHK